MTSLPSRRRFDCCRTLVVDAVSAVFRFCPRVPLLACELSGASLCSELFDADFLVTLDVIFAIPFAALRAVSVTLDLTRPEAITAQV